MKELEKKCRALEDKVEKLASVKDKTIERLAETNHAQIYACVHCSYRSLHVYAVRRHQKLHHQDHPVYGWEHICDLSTLVNESINKLAKILKNKCAAGGTVKGRTIELQGDHKKKAAGVLNNEGFNVEVR